MTQQGKIMIKKKKKKNAKILLKETTLFFFIQFNFIEILFCVPFYHWPVYTLVCSKFYLNKKLIILLFKPAYYINF